MNIRKLTRPAFHAWLEAQAEGSVVGSRRKESCCPIANFLDKNVLVYNWYVLSSEGVKHDIPRWATRFINLVDGGSDVGTPITREEALAALGDVS